MLYFDYNFTDVCSQGSNRQSSSIGLDNGLAPNRWQAIIWTNADSISWRIYATLGGDELTQMFIVSVCVWITLHSMSAKIFYSSRNLWT